MLLLGRGKEKIHAYQFLTMWAFPPDIIIFLKTAPKAERFRVEIFGGVIDFHLLTLKEYFLVIIRVM